METRRDAITRLFAAGAVILPAAAADITGRLIEPAKVEIIDRPQSILTPGDEFKAEEVVRTRVAFTMADGTERVIEAQWCKGERTSGTPLAKARPTSTPQVPLVRGDRIQFDLILRRTDFTGGMIEETSPALGISITEVIVRGGAVIK